MPRRHRHVTENITYYGNLKIKSHSMDLIKHPFESQLPEPSEPGSEVRISDRSPSFEAQKFGPAIQGYFCFYIFLYFFLAQKTSEMFFSCVFSQCASIKKYQKNIWQGINERKPKNQVAHFSINFICVISFHSPLQYSQQLDELHFCSQTTCSKL